MRKLVIGICIIIIAVALVGYCYTTTTTVVKQTKPTITDAIVMDKYNEIKALPYSEYKCGAKADLLLEYIHSMDETATVYKASMEHQNGQYAHAYVIYKGMAYDPTNNIIQPLAEYESFLESQGFTKAGKPVTTPEGREAMTFTYYTQGYN